MKKTLWKTPKIWSIPLNELGTKYDLSRQDGRRRVLPKTTYHWPDREPMEKADKQDVKEIAPQFNNLLDILRDKQAEINSQA